MGVHAAAVLAEQRLGHERRVQAVLHRVLLDRDAIGHAVVGHLQGVLVAHVDLVLARPDLVVGVLGVDPELFERQHGLAPEIRPGVERREVEVAALVEDLGRLRVAEVEVLELGTDVEVVEAHVVRAAERAAEDVAGVALVRSALGRLDVAEHPRHALLLRSPGQHSEGARIGHRDHVRLLDRVEAGDRGAVEAHPALEGVGELGGVDRERLELAEDVGEPQADEADVPLGRQLDHVGGRRRCLVVAHARAERYLLTGLGSRAGTLDGVDRVRGWDRRRLALLLAALGVTALLLTVPGRAAGHSCGPGGARTLAHDTAGRVYAVGTTVSACANVNGHTFRLGTRTSLHRRRPRQALRDGRRSAGPGR